MIKHNIIINYVYSYIICIERLQLRHKLTSRTLPCGKKNVSGMAKTSERHLSEVYHKLEPKAKERYLEKIAYIRSEDPYTLRKADFFQGYISSAFSQVANTS